MRGVWLQQTCRELQENMTIVNMRGDGITSLEKEMENKDESFMNQKLFFLLSFKINMVPSRSLSSLLLRRLSVLWVDIVQMVFGADSIPIVPIYVNFCENNEKLIIAWQVHDVNAC